MLVLFRHALRLRFDAAIWVLGFCTFVAQGAGAVLVSQTVPERGETISALATIEVFFSADVTGVDAADLLVNRVAAEAVSSFGARQYVFTVSEPAPGPVTVSWASVVK